MNSNTSTIAISLELDYSLQQSGDIYRDMSDVTEPLVSNTAAYYVKLFIFVIACGLVSITGIIANVINIIVFVRQGVFSSGGSPTLLGLSVSDLCSVASMLWSSISASVVLAKPSGLSWDPWDVYYLTGWLHLMFGQITRMVTAYMAFERCVCVVFPFNVKSLFTPKRTVVTVGIIFIGVMATYSPVFILQRLEFKFDVYTNTSRWVMMSYPGINFVRDVLLYYTSIICNMGSVAIVMVCTTITVSKIKISKAWRESMAKTSTSSKGIETAAVSSENKSNSGQEERSSKLQRETKLVQMITMISVVFLVCYVPDLCNVVMYSADPEIAPFGVEENLAMLVHSLTFLLETVNSTVNILIYYNMSSRYRQEFDALFGLKSA